LDWSSAVKPSGRFSRSQFAFFYFVPIFISLVLYVIAQAFELFLLIAIPWSLFQIYLVIIAGVRRFHDLNRSGWYLLLAFIPLVNVVMILYLLFAPGKVEGNRWD
jgi:uncharacterized membrane protein YhaH (DUF805 family)